MANPPVAPGRFGMPLPAVALLGGVAVLSVSVTTGLGPARGFAALLLLGSALLLAEGTLKRWPVLLNGLVVVILFVPVDRYDISVGLPFTLDPYRGVVALLITIWVGSLLIDVRIRGRRTTFERPLAL